MWKKAFKPIRKTGSLVVQEEVLVDDGKTRKRVRKPIQDAYDELPPFETFSLDNLLKAGVPLEEVNCKILGNSPSYSEEEALLKELDKKPNTIEE